MNGPLGDLAGWAAGRFKLQESPLPHRFALIGVCVLYLTLAVWYTQSAPVLEIGDEIWHYQVADHLAAGRGLLVQGTTPGAGIGHQEASQPPLYYLGAAATIRLLDPDPEQPRFLWNPWSYAGWQGAGATPFLLLHTTAERFPGEGYARIAHLLRLQSVLFGLGTVLGVYAIGRLTAPKRPALALLMAALVAFNPGFLLVSSVVGNDSLAICLTTLAALALFGPAARTGRWPAYAAFGVLAALAGLTKVSALTILLPAALLILYQSRRVVCLLAVGLPVLLINGWWFVRNLMLYGELTGTRRMALIAGLRDQPLSVEQWVREVASVWASYWGIRAEALPVWARVALPVAMLALLGLGAYVALRRPAAADLGGAGSFGWGDRQRWVELALHAVWAASLFGLLLVWTAQTPASYGRLLYPGIAAFTLLLVVGLARLLPPALFRGLALAVPLGLLVWAGLFPSRVLAHEFRDLRWPAPAQAVDRPLETPAGALPISRQPRQRYGDRIVLDEVRLNAGWYTPEEPVGLTLTWRGLGGSTALEGLVYLLCPGNQVVGLARVPLDVPAGTRAESRLAVPAATPTEPSLCQVVVGVDDPVTGPLPVLDESGRPISAKQPTAEFRLAPLRRPVPPVVTDGATEFGGVFRLLGAQPVDPLLRPGATSSLFLFWESLAPVDEFWTVFVHLLGPDGRIVAQDDGPPAGGGAPTWTWRTGAIVADRHQLKIPESLPPGEYRLIVGFYRSDPPGRLPAADGSDHSVVLTEWAPGGGG